MSEANQEAPLPNESLLSKIDRFESNLMILHAICHCDVSESWHRFGHCEFISLLLEHSSVLFFAF